MKREKGLCFECGGKFVTPYGQFTKAVVRQVDGYEVRMHKQCADGFDKRKPLTAQETKHE